MPLVLSSIFIYADRLVHATLRHARGAAQRVVQLAPPLPGRRLPVRVEAATGVGEQTEHFLSVFDTSSFVI